MEFSLYSSLSKEEWNKFILANGGSFLQSWEWGEFQKKEGHGVSRAAVKENGELLLCATIVHHALPFRKWYWYVPYGPVVAGLEGAGREAARFFLSRIGNAAPANTVFVKVEPDAGFDASLFPKGWEKSSKDVQVRETVVMDLSRPEDELFAGMKQKTRYNIKVAFRHGVKAVSPDDQKSLDREIFFSLLGHTAKRQGFHLHPKKYYLDMMDMFLSEPAGAGKPAYAERLFFAQVQGDVCAAALVGLWGARATYLHGASGEAHKNVMAPHLLHWEIMRWAKAHGFSEYDFWGVDTSVSEDEAPAGHWEGLSRFKIGFGGAVVKYCGAYDFSLLPIWYDAYKIGRQYSHILKLRH